MLCGAKASRQRDSDICNYTEGQGRRVGLKGLVFKISRYRDFAPCAVILGEYSKRAY